MDLDRLARTAVVPHPGRASPWLVRLARRVAEPALRLLHRPTLSGAEHLPACGPYLLVANHSGGLGLSELVTVATLYLRDVGPDRPLAGFAHPMAFHVPVVARLLAAVGAVPSSYEAAHRALAAGVPLLVFPGGDHETMRPLWDAHRVDFGGRLGFLRIAREAGVPVVPLGIRGGHLTAPVLLRLRRLSALLVGPHLLGVKRWGLSALGLLGAAAIAWLAPLSWPARAALIWLWLGSPLVFLPWLPWTLRLRIGPPLAPSELFADGPGGDLRPAYERVQAAVQALVDR